MLGAVPAASAPQPNPPKITFGKGGIDLRNPRIIQIFLGGVTSVEKLQDDLQKQPLSSWQVQIDKKAWPVWVDRVEVVNEFLLNVEISEALPTPAVLKDLASVHFDGVPAIGLSEQTVEVKEQKGTSSRFFWPVFNFTKDKKNANLDVLGSLQSTVAAKPQYQWNVTAQAPVEVNASNWIFTAGPKFTGVASQETNADPDSLSASLATGFHFPFLRVPTNILVNPIDYEFERKAKQEAVLTNGKPTLHSYQQKNTNLIASGELQFVGGFGQGKKAHTGFPVGLNINIGTEIGSASSRSVLNKTDKPGYSDNPLRAIGGSDVYFNVLQPKKWKYPLLNVDGHYTVRLPFHPEPFQEAGVNNGNQFYSTQARHYITANLAHTIATGSNVTVKYLYGSLPPTFSFVDHQVTIGFEVVLGK
jgi:hypothetical protein